MALTFLQITNEVLKRLREDTCTTTNDTEYTKLIANLVNVAKRQVENAWNWIVLRHDASVSCTSAATEYSISNTNEYSRIIQAYNVTKKCPVLPVSWEKAMDLEYGTDSQGTGTIEGYRISGRDSATGVLKFKVYPRPQAGDNQNILFQCCTPTQYVTSDATPVAVPGDIVINAGYMLAVAERGDDGGLNVQNATDMYKASLGDAVSIEESLNKGETTWAL